jgi:hypothetical protein
MPVVGELVVNLKAQTASFTDSMGQTRRVFADFGEDAKTAGRAVDFSMRDARGSMMLLGEEAGVHIPRELRTLIAELPGVGAAFAALVPIVGAAFAVGLVYKYVEEHKKAADEIKAAWEKVGSVGAEAFEHVGMKMLDVQIRADELAGDHLGALQKRLEKVDRTTLDEIVAQFEKLGKETDEVFAKIEAKSGWFAKLMGGVDAGPAKTELENMMAAVAKLKTMPADGGNGVRALLGTDIETVKGQIDEIEKKMKDLRAARDEGSTVGEFESAAATTELNALQAQKEMHERMLVPLQTELEYAKQRAAVGEGEKANDRTAAAQQAAQALEKLNDRYVKLYSDAEKGEAAVRALQEGLTDVMLTGWERYSRAANKTLEEQIAWQGKAKTAADEVTEAHLRGDERIRASKEQLATASRKATGEGDRDAIKQQAELGLISKREEREQLAAIDQTELQDLRTAHQTELGELQQHLQAMKAAQAADPGNVTAINNAVNAQAKLNEENTKFIALQAQLKSAIAANDAAGQKMASSWKLYFGQMQTETKDLATQIRTTLEGSVNQFTKAFGDSMARAIVENKSLGQAVREEAGHMLESQISMLVQWLEKWIITHTMAAVIGTATDKTAQTSAATLAGANMVASWSAAPWPIDAAAPAMGATAFGAAMAFAGGGEVPGYGFGDSVPAMLTPGETVVTKALTEQVKSSGGGGAGHVHIHMPTIHALDAEGVSRVLDRHAALISKSVANHLRKQSRRGH